MSGGNILGGEYTRVERSGGIFRGGVYLEPFFTLKSTGNQSTVSEPKHCEMALTH